MKKTLLKLAVLAALAVSAQAHAAAGFVALPSTGFANSAYTNCFNDGRTAADPKSNFGSIGTWTVPTASANNTCWVAKTASELTLPSVFTGYSLVGSRTVTIPSTTGGTGNIGTLVDYVWRNSTTNMCVIGTRATMINADHDTSTAALDYFEINDLARGGFAGLGAVSVAYALFSTNAYPVYRAGRTFTSVQHRALTSSSGLNGSNYLDLPTKISVNTVITGEAAYTSPTSTTLAKQDAVVNENWVDFTMHHKFILASPVSPFTYIQFSCASTPTVQANAIRLRQTGQEGQALKEIVIPGYVPAGAVIP